MEYPIVAVVSIESESMDLLSNIRKIPNDSNTKNFEDSTLYMHDINTKYYNTKVALLPVENVFNLSDSVKKKLEGILIHFDSHDRSFLEIVPTYVDFIKKHPVELFILLCNELQEDCKSGITFKCIKDFYNKIDIIELKRTSCDNEDDHFGDEASGYDELSEALKCTLWSNVSVDSSNTMGFLNSSVTGEVSDQIEESGVDVDDDSIEEEINNFENLLSQVMQFRSNTSFMTRDDRLNSAQHIAEVFEKLLLQDEGMQKNLPSE